MRKSLIVAIGGILFSGDAAFGQNWINPAGGSWGDPSNWSGDALPTSPVFDLNSPSGYTVTLPTNETIWWPQTVTLQNDNTTFSLGGYYLATSGLYVAANSGQTGTLTLLGPGGISLNYYGYQGFGSGAVHVGDNGGTGELIVNGASIGPGGEVAGEAFDVSNLLVENGGAVKDDGFNGFTYNITNGTFNDGSLETNGTLSLNQFTLLNKSGVGAGSVTLGSGSVDNSGIGGDTVTVNGTVTLSDSSSLNADIANVNGTVTLSNSSTLSGPDQLAVNGTLNLLSGSEIGSPNLVVNGTINLQLNGPESYPISRPRSYETGILNITLQDGFTPTLGEQFDILNVSFPPPAPEGNFGVVNVPPLPDGESWDLSNLYTNGTITVVPEAGSLGILVIALAGFVQRRRHA